MIILYKQRFLKVFLAGSILLIIGWGGMMWSVQSIYSIISSNADLSNLGSMKVVVFISALTLFVGEILYIYGHYLLAKGKGYSAWLTLLGLINIFGLLILFLLPDRRRDMSFRT